MTLVRPLSVLTASVDEATANARFIDLASRYITESSEYVFQADRNTPVRRNLDLALKLRETAPDTTFRGLIVQIVGVFESFIVDWCAARLTELEQKLDDGTSELEPRLRHAFLAKAGIALQHLPSGTVLGAKFSFADLERSLPTILLDSRPIKFHPEVISVRLGTCNSDKLETLYDFFGFPPLFRKELGSHKSTVAWRIGSASPTAIAQLIKRELNDLMDLRNDLAHGQRRTVTIDNVINAGKLVVALATAMSD